MLFVNSFKVYKVLTIVLLFLSFFLNTNVATFLILLTTYFYYDKIAYCTQRVPKLNKRQWIDFWKIIKLVYSNWKALILYKSSIIYCITSLYRSIWSLVLLLAIQIKFLNLFRITLLLKKLCLNFKNNFIYWLFVAMDWNFSCYLHTLI